MAVSPLIFPVVFRVPTPLPCRGMGESLSPERAGTSYLLATTPTAASTAVLREIRLPETCLARAASSQLSSVGLLGEPTPLLFNQTARSSRPGEQSGTLLPTTTSRSRATTPLTDHSTPPSIPTAK